MNTSLASPSLLQDLYYPCACTTNSISLACAGAIANCLSITWSTLCSCFAIASPPLLPAIVIIATSDYHWSCGHCYPDAAVTINAAIRTCCRRRHVLAPIGGVVDNDDAIVADAPAAPPLLPSGMMDPTAATLTKTHDDTAAATAMATAAMVTEEEECDRCNGADPQRRMDDSLLHLADRILLCSITVTTVPRCSGGGVWRP